MNLQETLEMQRELNRLTDNDEISLSDEKVVQMARVIEDAWLKLSAE